jgi:hypothetical protein
MQPSNALQQMLRANHAGEDLGDGKHLVIDRDRFYYSLNPAGTETRILDAPSQAGLVGHIGCKAAQTVVVTVKNSAGATTGTITFTAASQWIGVISCELTDGVYSWQATDVYGCTTTIQTAQNWSAAVAAGTMTTLVVTTGLTAAAASIPALTAAAAVITSMTAASTARAASVIATALTATGLNATSVTAGSCAVSSNLSAASILATNLSVATGVTANAAVVAALTATALNIGTGGRTETAALPKKGVSFASSGGSTNASAMQLPSSPSVLLNVTSAGAFFKTPTAGLGLEFNVVNVGSASGIIVGDATTRSVAGATTAALAVAGGLDLICDGTNWLKKGT